MKKNLVNLSYCQYGTWVYVAMVVMVNMGQLIYHFGPD